MATLTDRSKDNFDASNPVTHDELRTGCIQRIATAVEGMQKPYLNLLADVKYLSQRVAELRQQNDRMANRLRAYRGVITRMKKKKS